MSLKQRIYNYLKRQNKWISSAQIEDLARGAGYKSSNAGRRCRELVEAGLVERKMQGKIVWYHYKGSDVNQLLPDKKPNQLQL